MNIICLSFHKLPLFLNCSLSILYSIFQSLTFVNYYSVPRNRNNILYKIQQQKQMKTPAVILSG